MTPNTDSPNYDSPNTADNDAAYPYSLRNRKKKKKNITLNTYAPEYDYPDSYDGYSASPDSLTLDSSFKHKIDPKTLRKLKKWQ